MEPKLIVAEACNRFFIVEQRWGFETLRSTGFTNEPSVGSFEAAYIFNGMQGPYSRVYKEWCRHDNRTINKPSFVYIVEARNKRQVVAEMLRLGHMTMFNNKWQDSRTQQCLKALYGSYTESTDFFEFNAEEATMYEQVLPSEARLKVLERRQALLDAEVLKELEKQERMARFGQNSDYADGTVITWEQRYEANNKVYTFVALKAAGRWYTTSTFQRQAWGWDVLVEEYLSKAEEDSVFIVAKWEQL